MKKKTLLIMIVVLIASIFIIQSSFALYRIASTSNGSIATATWNVTLNQTNEEDHISVISGNNESLATYTVNVESTSEVDITYTIEVSDIPEGVKVAIDDGEFQTPVNNKVTFTDAGTILYSANDHTNSNILKFKAEGGTSTVTDSEIDVDVIVKQKINN